MSNKKQIVLTNQPNTFPGFPHAVKSHGLVFLSGIRPNQDTGLDGGFSNIPIEGHEKKQGFLLTDQLESRVAHDAWYSHKNMDAVLEFAGSGGDQILRQHIWQKDKRFFPVYQNIRQVLQKIPAPSSGLGVSDVFGNKNITIGIDGIAVCAGDNPDLLAREVVVSFDDKELPSASFYSQAVSSGPLVFTAGHIPIKTSEAGKPVVSSFNDVPKEGRFLETGQSHPDSRDGPIAAQTWYVYNELKRTLENQGLKLSDTINSTVFLADVRDFPTFHRIHRHFFPDMTTALTVSGFDEVGHRGCLIEIELTASKPHPNFEKAIIEWHMDAPFAAPASASAGSFIFYSGILGLNSECSLVVDLNDFDAEPQIPQNLHPGDDESKALLHQSWAALQLLSKVSQNSGSSIDELVKVTVYIPKQAYFEIFEKVFFQFVSKENLPAIECVIIPYPGPVPEAKIQIEAIGIKS
tara:strand:+ start:1997 stop:3388 length:1392 start_codon:yes stop_codon:yes gene_type:complete